MLSALIHCLPFRPLKKRDKSLLNSDENIYFSLMQSYWPWWDSTLHQTKIQIVYKSHKKGEFWPKNMILLLFIDILVDLSENCTRNFMWCSSITVNVVFSSGLQLGLSCRDWDHHWRAVKSNYSWGSVYHCGKETIRFLTLELFIHGKTFILFI